MSLWAAEVEKSKTNPIPPRRRQARKTTAEQILLVQSPGRNRDNFRSLLGSKPAVRPDLETEGDRLEAQRDVIGERDTLLQENAKLRKRIRKMADENITQMPTSQENIAQLADLIVQKIELERDIRTREAKYETLLRESQDLMNTMRSERDAALQKLQAVQQEPASFPDAGQRPAQPEVQAPRDILDFGTVFEPHDDDHFKYQFHALEQAIKQFTLSSMAAQADSIPPRDITPAMDIFIQKHSIQIATVYGIRDIRCLLARSFCVEFLMDKIFRVFLFGLDPEHGRLLQEASQLFMRTSESVEAGSKWAAKIARLTIRSSSAYKPLVAAERLTDELTSHLSALMGGQQHSAHRTALLAVVKRAVELARECRLDYSSFAIELPAHLADFDALRMECSRREEGRVAVAYAPVVSRRGDQYGEGYDYGPVVVAKAKVWRESIFSSVQNLRDEPPPKRGGYGYV